MPLVYAGVCSHAPGITGRADQADPEVRDAFYAAFEIRTFIAVSGAAAGSTGQVHFYAPIPIFSVGCTIASYDLNG